MVDHAETSGGLRFQVYAQPRASRSTIVGEHDGMLKVALAAPPVDGAANAALVELLAERFGVRRADVSITAGATGRRKTVLVRGGTARRLRELLSG